jgi:hypothetical protein
MSTPLSAEQKTSIEKVLDFLKRLLDCYDDHKPAGSGLTDQEAEMRKDLSDLRDLLTNGKIDIERHTDAGRKARTDGDGIHLNDRSTYQMPADYLLNDCQEGFFGSLWQLIETLIHELYHYRHHTGFVSNATKIVDTIFGGLALITESALGETQRTWLWHEKKAYRYAYSKLGFLRVALIIACDNHCFECCDRLQTEVDEAIKRQDPSTNYGG